MRQGDFRCQADPKYIAVERSHPRGPFWETGTGLKAHHWFILPLSKARHLEYDADHDAFEAKYGTHAELLLTFWKSIGFEPGEFMTVGMTLRRAAWLERGSGETYALKTRRGGLIRMLLGLPTKKRA